MESTVKVQRNWLADASVGIIGIFTLIFGVEYMPAYLAGGIAGIIWGVGGFYHQVQGVWKSVPLRVGLIVAIVLVSGTLANFLESWF